MASTVNPSGGLILAAMAVMPQWSRPDDAERQARLDAMKRRATGLLAVALLVFVGASLYEAQFPWLGYVRATAEASLVGGLADWFAVTALFRHPLGLPIPHTAIVATRKERIGQILGNFVQNHFLSRDVIAANLRQVHPAERAAQWLADREHARQFSRQFASGLAKTLENLPTNELQDLVSQVVRNRVRAETPWWVPPVLDDKIYQKIIAAVERLLHDMVMDPAHPLRGAFDEAIRDFIERAEALKEEWLMGAATDDLSRKLWEGIRQAVNNYAAGGGDGSPTPLDSGLSEFGTALLSNPTLLAEIDDLLIDVTASVVEKYRHEIGDLIAKTVAGWDPQATSQRFELAVGRDLQFVRINGTLVGGLVGLAIYTITHLLR